MAFQKRVALIAGPTASGKSALAIAMARERGGVVINADAMQVYRELRILTARPSPKDELAAPHRLYGHVPGSEAYSVARWLADASAAIEAAWQEGRLPILTGGTGLYFRSIEKGLAVTPAVPAAVRAHLRQRLAAEGAATLHESLKSSDPTSYSRLKPMDAQRILRALEVVEATGMPIGHWHALTAPPRIMDGVDIERHFVDVPRAELYRRAETRFDGMIDNGAVEEVRALPRFDPALSIMKAIGVRELSAHIRGEATRESAAAAAKTATRHYIKRQLTWWRGQGWNV
jgi:tRNA dimethylallyltransferase